MTSTATTPVERLRDRAQAHFERSDLEIARSLFEATQWAAEATEARGIEATAWTQLGWIAHYECDLDRALTAFGAAADLYAVIGDRAGHAESLTRLAFAEYALGSPEAAAERLERVQPTGARLEGVVAGYEANLARSVGDHELARQRYRAAAELLPPADVLRAVFLMDEAVLDLLDGRADDAQERLEKAREADTGTEPVFTIYRRHYAVLTAGASFDLERWEALRREPPAPPSPTVEVFEWTQEAVGALARGEPAPDLHALEPPSEHARLSLRIVRGAFARRDARTTRRLLRVDREGLAMQVDRGVPARFRADSPAWRILLALVDAPSALSPEALIAAGWPDERILPKAARNRLHVTLAGLRRRGLEDDLAFDDGSYAIRLEIEQMGHA